MPRMFTRLGISQCSADAKAHWMLHRNSEDTTTTIPRLLRAFKINLSSDHLRPIHLLPCSIGESAALSEK